jgi:hypothetical protein
MIIAKLTQGASIQQPVGKRKHQNLAREPETPDSGGEPQADRRKRKRLRQPQRNQWQEGEAGPSQSAPPKRKTLAASQEPGLEEQAQRSRRQSARVPLTPILKEAEQQLKFIKDPEAEIEADMGEEEEVEQQVSQRVHSEAVERRVSCDRWVVVET